ncbi:hypothetical protein OROHE_005628 [Orobanche hederae]
MSAATEAPLPFKTAPCGGPGGKITDEFTGQGHSQIEMLVNSPPELFEPWSQSGRDIDELASD